MSLTRRGFLMSGAVTALAAATLGAAPFARGQGKTKPDPAADFPIPFEARQSSLFNFRRETFRPYVGGLFRLRAGANSVQATLTEVRDCTASAASAKVTKGKPKATDCFALIFQSKDKLTDLTTIYDVEHAALGTFALFLTTREAADGTYVYEAVFNHAL
jgi:hypothetical protein